MTANSKQKFFVAIDGTDGSGKGTQSELLKQALEKMGLGVYPANFPRYTEPSSYFVREMLNGKYGPIEDIHPEVASMFYALDRFAAKPDLEAALAQGKTIISDRYVSANMGHQMGKIKTPLERKTFIEWLYDLEYIKHGIPKPDKVLFLHVPPEIGSGLIDKKTKNREYLNEGEKRDMAEKNLAHQKAAESAFLYCCTHLGDWAYIDCIDEKGKILTENIIHQLVLKEIQPFL